MPADRNPGIALVIAAHRLAELEVGDIPTILGDLERLRATLWARMIRAWGMEVRAPAVDDDEKILTVPEVAREPRFTTSSSDGWSPDRAPATRA